MIMPQLGHWSYWYAWKRSRGVKIRIAQRRNIRQFHKTFFPRATSRLQWNFSPVHKIHKVNKRTTVCWDTATVNSYSSSSSQQRTNSSQQWQRNCPLDSAERIETSYNGNRGQNIKLQLCRTLINTGHFYLARFVRISRQTPQYIAWIDNE